MNRRGFFGVLAAALVAAGVRPQGFTLYNSHMESVVPTVLDGEYTCEVVTPRFMSFADHNTKIGDFLSIDGDICVVTLIEPDCVHAQTVRWP